MFLYQSMTKSFSDEEVAESYPQLKRFTQICDSQGSTGLSLENYDMFSRLIIFIISHFACLYLSYTSINFLQPVGPYIG